MRRSLREEFHEPAVACARFKHLRFAGVSTCFEVDHDAHIFSRWIFRNERGSAEQPVFFAVSDHKKNVIAQWWAGPQGAKRFEQSSHTRTIVTRPRTSGNGVIVRDQRDGIRRTVRAFQSGNDIFHSSRDFVARRDARGSLYFGSEPEFRELLHQIIAHPVVLCRTEGMRRGREGIQINEGSICGKNILRCSSGYGSGNSVVHRTHARNQQNKQKYDPTRKAIVHRRYPLLWTGAAIVICLSSEEQAEIPVYAMMTLFRKRRAAMTSKNVPIANSASPSSHKC